MLNGRDFTDFGVVPWEVFLQRGGLGQHFQGQTLLNRRVHQALIFPTRKECSFDEVLIELERDRAVLYVVHF